MRHGKGIGMRHGSRTTAVIVTTSLFVFGLVVHGLSKPTIPGGPRFLDPNGGLVSAAILAVAAMVITYRVGVPSMWKRMNMITICVVWIGTGLSYVATRIGGVPSMWWHAGGLWVLGLGLGCILGIAVIRHRTIHAVTDATTTEEGA